MARLELAISFLLLASFALLLIPVISASAAPTIYFARVAGSDGISNLRVGMWGACSTGIGFSGARNIRGCTSGNGAYALTAELPATSNSPYGITQGPPDYYELDVLSSRSTGPLICLLVSFLLVVISVAPWFHDVFKPNHKLVGLDRFSCWILWLVSMILAWTGFGYAGHLKTDLDSSLDVYRSSGVQAQIYKTSYGNAVWCSLVGSITVTLLWLFQSKRWNDLVAAKRLGHSRQRETVTEREAKIGA